METTIQNPASILALTGAYQASCVIIAASELDLFTELIKRNGASIETLTNDLALDKRALQALFTALSSIKLLNKDGDVYTVTSEYAPILDSRSDDTIVPMLRHQGSCLRGWVQLAQTLQSGAPAPVISGIRDAKSEFQDFILAMNVVAKSFAPKIAQKLFDAGLLQFERALDLGGASGTYSFAFLEKNPNNEARAVIFDRPAAIKEAQKKAACSASGKRIEFFPGDFYVDPYPQDFDFVWISAIIHQQDSVETEKMFQRSFEALRSNGRIAVRDVYVNDELTGPVPAAFFGVNMIVRTPSGKVYGTQETIDLLTKVGFRNARLVIPANDMGAVIVAEKD